MIKVDGNPLVVGAEGDAKLLEINGATAADARAQVAVATATKTVEA